MRQKSGPPKPPNRHNLVWASQIIRLTLVKVRPDLAARVSPDDLMKGFTPNMNNVRYCVRLAQRQAHGLTQKDQGDLARAWDYMQRQDRNVSKERFAR